MVNGSGKRKGMEEVIKHEWENRQGREESCHKRIVLRNEIVVFWLHLKVQSELAQQTFDLHEKRKYMHGQKRRDIRASKKRILIQ